MCSDTLIVQTHKYAMRLIHANATSASRLRGAASRILNEIYIQRLSDPADRAAALSLLRATGLA